MTLLVDFCSYEAAAYAVKRWHYSETMPMGKLVKIGVWESDLFVGAVIFGRGASASYGKAYGVDSTEVCELVRVALRDHAAPVTEILAGALRKLKSQSPGLRVVVSFADTAQGHVGTIYQAGNWTYLGTLKSQDEYLYHGRWVHGRLFNGTVHGSSIPELAQGLSYAEIRSSLKRRPGSIKHRYAYPLDRGIRRQLNKRAEPYPAAQVSEARHRTSGAKGQVQSLGAAP